MEISKRAAAKNTVKENIGFILFVLLMLIGTWKYANNGEPYTFETGKSTLLLNVSQGDVLTQPILVNDESIWKDGAWSVKFGKASERIGGGVKAFTDPGRGAHRRI